MTDLKKVLIQNKPQKPTANMLLFPQGRDLIPSIESQAPEVYSQTLKPNEICPAGFQNCLGLITVFPVPVSLLNGNVYSCFSMPVSHCILGADNLFSSL